MSVSTKGSSLSSSNWISASGLADAQLRLNASAHNVANANTPGFRPQQVTSQAQTHGGVISQLVQPNAALPEGEPPPFSQTDLSMEGLNLILAKSAFQANAHALQTNAQVEKQLLDTLA